VVLAAVEQQEVLADLVEDERLADGSPRRLEGAHVQHDHQQDEHGDGDRRVDGVDDEAHDERAEQTEQRRVRREAAERRPTASATRDVHTLSMY